MSIIIQENIILSSYTIYKIGGRARFFVEVKNSEELKEALEMALAHDIKFFILGAGSNILVSDKGFDGLVIRMVGGEIKVEDNKLIVDSGVMMASAVNASAKAGLTGFEWAIGVPGTVGGSVRGNAGCFGFEIKDFVESVQVCQVSNVGCQVSELTSKDCQFGYRDTIFKKHPEWAILSVILKLEKGDTPEIQARIKKISEERTKKQDIGTKSCGCIFKNVSWTRSDIRKDVLLDKFPELKQFEGQLNIPASFLIDESGFKGRCFGKICVSTKHANFFVNEGGATAEEVVIAIAAAKDAVKRKYGIVLEEEIQYVGF